MIAGAADLYEEAIGATAALDITGAAVPYDVPYEVPPERYEVPYEVPYEDTPVEKVPVPRKAIAAPLEESRSKIDEMS